MGFSRQVYWSGLPFPAAAAATAARSLQSCPTLCDPIDGSPLGSTIPGILQARTLEWAAISFSNAWKWKGKVKSLRRVQLFATPWTAAYQAPLSMGFSRQEYWSGVPLPSPFPSAVWATFCQNSPLWAVRLGWPYTAWLIVSELDKAVVHVIRLVRFLWLWFSVCLSPDGER